MKKTRDKNLTVFAKLYSVIFTDRRHLKMRIIIDQISVIYMKKHGMQ